MDKQARPTPCGLCGRDVATRFQRQRRLVNRQPDGADKERVPHKCPHGEWCAAGGVPGKPPLGLRTHHAKCAACRSRPLPQTEGGV